MKCKVCGSREIYNGSCYNCGYEDKNHDKNYQSSFQDMTNLFNDDYDAGFVAGKTQALADFSTSFLNIRLMERGTVPKTIRQMGYIDGYCNYIDSKRR